MSTALIAVAGCVRLVRYHSGQVQGERQFRDPFQSPMAHDRQRQNGAPLRSSPPGFDRRRHRRNSIDCLP